MYVVWYKQNPIYVCSKVQDAIDLVCLEIEGASLISISKPRSAVDAAPRRRSFEYVLYAECDGCVCRSLSLLMAARQAKS